MTEEEDRCLISLKDLAASDHPCLASGEFCFTTMCDRTPEHRVQHRLGQIGDTVKVRGMMQCMTHHLSGTGNSKVMHAALGSMGTYIHIYSIQHTAGVLSSVI